MYRSLVGLAPERGGSGRLDIRLVAAVLAGVAGVARVLRPTIEDEQLWHGLIGLASRLIAALQYLGLAFSFLFGMLVLGVQLTVACAAGIVLIIAAGVAATLLRPRPRTDPAAPTES